MESAVVFRSNTANLLDDRIGKLISTRSRAGGISGFMAIALHDANAKLVDTNNAIMDSIIIAPVGFRVVLFECCTSGTKM